MQLRMKKVTNVGVPKQLGLVFRVTLGWLLFKKHMGRFRIIELIFIVAGAGLSYFARQLMAGNALACLLFLNPISMSSIFPVFLLP